MNPELHDTSGAEALSKLTESSLYVPENKDMSVHTAAAGAFSQLQQSSVNEPENKEVSVPTAVRAFSKLQQSHLFVF
jgi:hypothetical protein